MEKKTILIFKHFIRFAYGKMDKTEREYLDILLWIGVKELFYCSENVVHKLQKKLTNDYL